MIIRNFNNGCVSLNPHTKEEAEELSDIFLNVIEQGQDITIPKKYRGLLSDRLEIIMEEKPESPTLEALFSAISLI
jgi:hypothetical protein